MTTTPIKFYILQNDSHTDGSDAHSTLSQQQLLNFVCRLTQKVQKTSGQRMAIVDDNIDRLTVLNNSLWDFDPCSFIAHELFINKLALQAMPACSETTTQQYLVTGLNAEDLNAPVTLVNHLPDGFAGIVLNLTQLPLKLDNVSQILEIVTPDAISTDKGREKVRHYRGLNAKVDFFKVAIKA